MGDTHGHAQMQTHTNHNDAVTGGGRRRRQRGGTQTLAAAGLSWAWWRCTAVTSTTSTTTHQNLVGRRSHGERVWSTQVGHEKLQERGDDGEAGTAEPTPTPATSREKQLALRSAHHHTNGETTTTPKGNLQLQLQVQLPPQAKPHHSRRSGTRVSSPARHHHVVHLVLQAVRRRVVRACGSRNGWQHRSMALTNDLVHERQVVGLVRVGELTRENFPQHDAVAVHIHLLVVPLANDDLGCNPCGRTDTSEGDVAGLETGEAKVRHLAHPCLVQLWREGAHRDTVPENKTTVMTKRTSRARIAGPRTSKFMLLRSR